MEGRQAPEGPLPRIFQCDVDVIGSDSLLNEVELTKIIDDVFARLGISVVIKLNNRKILAGIAGMIGHQDKLTAMTVAIDKLDKIGIDAVCSEMAEKGISSDAIEKLKPVIGMTGSNSRKLEELASIFKENGPGREGTYEMKEVLDMLALLEIKNRVEFDAALARGLNYYTGTIFEVKSADVEIGSICGGGRYDDLTGVFGLEGLSGVGISFGADRIYDVLVQTGGFPTAVSASTRLMFVNFGQKEAEACLPLLEKLRRSGISAELYPDSVKMKKQMQYANNRDIPFVALIGEQELQDGTVTLRNMKTGDQQTITRDELGNHL
jgi:histidyl-tRNA synthetase